MAATDLFTLHALQGLGITLSAMIAGANIAVSLLAVPPLLMPAVSPSVAAQQWARTYSLGKSIAPPTAIVAASCNAYVLYRSIASWPTFAQRPDPTMLSASIVASLLIIPFTLILMETGTNKRMAKFADEGRKGGLGAKLDAEKVRAELQVWKGLNLFRGIFPAAGALLGFAATLV